MSDACDTHGQSKMAAAAVKTCITVVLVMCLTTAAGTAEYYMDMLCGVDMIDMEHQHITAGVLKVTSRSTYKENMNCSVIIRAPGDHRLLAKFTEIDIHEWMSDCDDYVQLIDGKSTGRALSPRLCDDHTPAMVFRSKEREMSVHFHSDDFIERKGFTLVFTAFRAGPCTSSEFQCKGGYCIDKSLECNGQDNCGDQSDECPSAAIASATVPVLILIVIGTVVAIVCVRRRRCRRNLKPRVPDTLQLATISHRNPESVVTTRGVSQPQPQAQSVPVYPQPSGYPPVNPTPAPYQLQPVASACSQFPVYPPGVPPSIHDVSPPEYSEVVGLPGASGQHFSPAGQNPPAYEEKPSH